MTDHYDSYLDDWLPEDEDDIEGSYDYDYDSVPKEPDDGVLPTIDEYEETRQKDAHSPDKDGLLWVYWR